jgi:GNAT superfamily N-acetyltransferase
MEWVVRFSKGMMIMIFETLNHNHIESLAGLALAEYFEEREAVPILPGGDYFELFCKMISGMVDHGLGVTVIDDGNVAGFLTCHEPRNNHFGTILGTFSPIYAHGAAKSDRKRIYSLLYQNAAAKWVKAGILSQAIALYAHDFEAISSFFWNGFGLRCVDAIRAVEPIGCDEFADYSFGEFPVNEVEPLVPLKNRLIEHLRSSPMFIPLLPDMDVYKVREENARRCSRYFVAKDGERLVAFIEVMESGENFACADPQMINICGAYMLPEYRGSGIFTKLLAYLTDRIKNEGYIRCGVDFESFNPTAGGFWLKYFTAYTYSVVRRIDERIDS